MRYLIRYLFALLASVLIYGDLLGGEDDIQIWNELKVTELASGNWRTYTWLETRHSEDASRLGLWLAQQKVYRRLNSGWEVGFGATYLSADTEGGWRDQSRFDVELNPRWELGNERVLILRNRLERRVSTGSEGNRALVARHRLSFGKRANWFGSMQRYEVSNEIFVDTESGRFFENRLRPLNVHFGMDNHAAFNGFLQLRSRRTETSGQWSHIAILGFGLQFGR